MESLINIGGERDLEQGLVELDEGQQIEVLEIDMEKREPIIAELNNALIGLERFAFFMVIISAIFIFSVLMGLTDSDKDKAPIAFTIFIVASFSAILVAIIIRFGRALQTKRIGPALPTKRLMLIGNVLLCIFEGFFIVSVFAAINLLVSFQLRWAAIYMVLAIWVMLVAIVLLSSIMLEFRIGFVGIIVSTSLALAIHFGGLAVVLFFSHRP